MKICEDCGRAGYDHRRIGILVDGKLTFELICCRHCAVDRISDAIKALDVKVTS